jgi:hypothetical protein
MTLRRLLLIFPAYLLGILLAGWWASYSTRGEHPHYIFALNHLRSIHGDVLYFEERYGTGTVSVDAINAWLAKKPLNDPRARQALRDDSVELDPWGNPYHCGRDMELVDGRVIPIGIYSLGEDGLSQTQGNDSDDINSWDENAGAYYRTKIRESNRKQYAIEGLLIAPFTYVALLAVGFALRRMFRHIFSMPRFGDIR